MDTEILSVRIDKFTFEALVKVKEHFGASFSDIVRKSIFFYLKKLLEDEKTRKELKDYIRFLEKKAKSDLLREQSRLIIKKYTLLYQQKKLLSKLQKQGLTDYQLEEVKKALKEEAKALNILEKSFRQGIRRKPLKIIKGKR